MTETRDSLKREIDRVRKESHDEPSIYNLTSDSMRVVVHDVVARQQKILDLLDQVVRLNGR